MSTNINIRVDEELKNALQGYARLEGKTVSEVVLDAVREKLENDYDYALALLAYESVDLSDTTTLADMCAEAGIEYESL
ncbi:MAG: ribbon-helix-helix protein, CopG family [Mogibacterium sp.]|nr:ribbon-helix-helix protein, CopG family [Mogibacterium sp.]